MGYAFEDWKVTYTRNYDTDYGEIGTIVNVTIGDSNIPLGHCGICSNDESGRNFARAEQIAHLIASAPDLLNALEGLMMTINTPEVPAAERARGFAMYLLKKLGSTLYREDKEQEEASA